MKKADIKVGFVILHYNDMKTTIKCIESILRLNPKECIEIVIVDNNSPNKTGEVIKDKYCNCSNIHVILLDKNYGFSRANNIGFQYIAKNKKVDFIIVANNDIIFCDIDMIDKLQQAYDNRGFYIAGPDIYAVYKKEHQSPLALRPRNKAEIKAWIAKNENNLRFIKPIHLVWIIINRTILYKLYINYLEKKRKAERDNEWNREKDNVMLSGACLFFSSKYIELGKKPFQPETRFYHEEDILTSRCLINQWKISYIPQIRVEHLEGMSTNMKGYYEKKKFRYTNFVKSGKIYLKYLEQEERNHV